MSWNNQDLTLYHGTDSASAYSILLSGVDLAKCSPFTDFGRGFYTTTNLEQAKNWARIKRRRVLPAKPSTEAAIIRLNLDRDWLAGLDVLAFVRSAKETDYPEFVRFCRGGGNPHRAFGNYDVVYGPVAVWQDLRDPDAVLFTIEDNDQISFHNPTLLTSRMLLSRAAVIWSE